MYPVKGILDLIDLQHVISVPCILDIGAGWSNTLYSFFPHEEYSY